MNQNQRGGLNVGHVQTASQSQLLAQWFDRTLGVQKLCGETLCCCSCLWQTTDVAQHMLLQQPVRSANDVAQSELTLAKNSVDNQP